MSRKDESGLFGSLYYFLKENGTSFRRAEEFYSFITSDENSAGKNPRKISYFIRYDCLTEKVSRTLLSELHDKNAYKQRFRAITRQMNYMQLSLLPEALISFVRKTESYCLRIPQGNAGTNESRLYSVPLREELCAQLRGEPTGGLGVDPEIISDLLYRYVYFAAVKTLPGKTTSEAAPKAETNEYTRLVTALYPSGGEGAYLAARQLADRADSPNPTACFHLGMQLLYGSEWCPADPDSGLRYLMKAAGLTDLSQYLPGSDPSAPSSIPEESYPPAVFALAQILFTYHRAIPGRTNPAENSASIRDLDRLSESERLSLSVHFAQEISESVCAGAALCLLGRIAASVSDAERAPLGLSEPESCFRQAAELGYLYAETNAAARCADRILCSEEALSDAETGRLIGEYRDHLTRASDFGITWAQNRLALFYLDGRILGSGSSAASAAFPEYADRNRSLALLNQAASGIPGNSSSWARINRLIYFPEYYEGTIARIMQDLETVFSLKNAVGLRFLQDELSQRSPFSARITPVLLLYLEQLIRGE